MKKIITAVAIVATLVAGQAQAQYRPGPGYNPNYNNRPNNNWVAPALIGGLVGAAIVAGSRPQPVYVQPQPVPYIPPQPVVQPNCQAVYNAQGYYVGNMCN
jgi:hypothetical protein